MGQLAIGGVLNLPKYDKTNQLVRDADGEIEWEERYFPPNVNALAHVLDRIDPSPNLEPQSGPGQFEHPALSDEAQVARGLANYALTKQALEILVALGADISTIPQAQWCADFEREMLTPAIEATASPAPDEPAKESEPAPTPSATTIATTIEPATATEPEPGRPKFEDAF